MIQPKSFISRFADSFVQLTAERMFRNGVRDFCVHFGPAELEKVAQSNRPLLEVIQLGGFTLKPTPPEQLNPWQRHLVGLSNQRLLELVRNSVPADHAVMLERYPQVGQGIIDTVKALVS